MLDTYNSGLKLSEACVICRFVIQKVDKNLDTSKDCPELAENQFIKEREETEKPDPYFSDKWRLFNILKKKQDIERNKPF